MNKRDGKIRNLRVFSESFKRSRVKEFDSGKFTVRELCSLYGFSNVSMYKWIYQYSLINQKGYKVVEDNDSASKKVKQLKDQLSEAERIIGQKQILIDYLEELIKQAKVVYDIDLKKNSDTPFSKNSGKTHT